MEVGFPELVFTSLERTENGMFSLGTRGGPQTISRCGPPRSKAYLSESPREKNPSTPWNATKTCKKVLTVAG